MYIKRHRLAHCYVPFPLDHYDNISLAKKTGFFPPPARSMNELSLMNQQRYHVHCTDEWKTFNYFITLQLFHDATRQHLRAVTCAPESYQTISMPTIVM